jgi:hypothetical protein
MWTKHNLEPLPVYDVRLSKFISLSTLVYELNQFVRVKLMGMSNGPLEVRRSLSSLKSARKIPAKRLSFLSSGQNLWIGSGYVTESTLKSIAAKQPKSLVLGPNLDIDNPYVRELLDSQENSIFLVPSDWVRNYYTENLGISPKKVLVWAAGIKTSEWLAGDKRERHVLIYVKGPYVELAHQVSEMLAKLDFATTILLYGVYRQNEYMNLLKKSKFAIFLNETESQGLAHFQSWSTNVPTLIISKNEYINPKKQNQVVSASSSPYLTSSTGMFFESTDIYASLDLFISRLDEFMPREWVLENYDAETTSRRFLQIFYPGNSFF